MINYIQVPRDQLVLQTRPVGNHDLAPLIGNDNASPSESDTFTKPYIAGDSEVIELGDVWDGFEAFLKVLMRVSALGCIEKQVRCQLTATFLK